MTPRRGRSTPAASDRLRPMSTDDLDPQPPFRKLPVGVLWFAAACGVWLLVSNALFFVDWTLDTMGNYFMVAVCNFVLMPVCVMAVAAWAAWKARRLWPVAAGVALALLFFLSGCSLSMFGFHATGFLID